MSNDALHLVLDPDSGTPLFEQLCEQVRRAAADGSLASGTRLPSTRELAASLGVAVNTVAKAYRALESEGVIEGRDRLGTFVRDADGAVAQRAASEYATAARAVGLSLEEATALLVRAWG